MDVLVVVREGIRERSNINYCRPLVAQLCRKRQQSGIVRGGIPYTCVAIRQ